MSPEVRREIAKAIEFAEHSRPSALEFQVVHHARVVATRIRFAIKHTESVPAQIGCDARSRIPARRPPAAGGDRSPIPGNGRDERHSWQCGYAAETTAMILHEFMSSNDEPDALTLAKRSVPTGSPRFG
jgi:hypothetical protein